MGKLKKCGKRKGNRQRRGGGEGGGEKLAKPFGLMT